MRKSALVTITTFLLALPLVSYAVTGDFLVPSWQSPSPSQAYTFGTHVVANGTWQLPAGWVGNIYVYKDATIDPSTGAITSAGTQAFDVNNGKGYYDISNAGGTTNTSGTWTFDIGAQTDGTHNMYITFWGGQVCAVNTALNASTGSNYPSTCPITTDNAAFNLVWPDRLYTVGLPPYPRMVITPATNPAFNYANTVVGAPVTNTFYITNTGQGSLTGTISGLPANFSCSSCAYVVNPGDGATAHPVYLTYAPPSALLSVDQNVSFSCGNTSPSSGCDGSAPNTISYQTRHIIGNSVTNAVPPAISVSSVNINYGTVNLGVSVADQPISVTNTGGGILNGAVTFTSAEYTCSGTCTYSLNAGQATTIWIHYVPVVVGTHNDSAGFSGGSGQVVTLQSVVNDKPIAQTYYGSVGFGTVNAGTCADRFEYVRNSGAGTLSGAVTVASPFSCVSASCTYSLTNAAGWQQVTLRYCPTSQTGDIAVASFSNTTNASAGAISNLSGNGNTSPIGGYIGNNYISFGSVLVNNTLTGSVTITNTGVGILNGSVGALPAGYTCTANCTYSIPAGVPVTITISFNPTLVQSYDGTVTLSGIGTLYLYGSGVKPDFGLSYTGWPFNTASACGGTFVCLPPSGATYDVGTTNFGGALSVQNKKFYLYIMNRGNGANVNYSFPNTAHFFCLGGNIWPLPCTGSLTGYGSGPYYEMITFEFRPDAATTFTEPLVVSYNYGDGVYQTVTLNLVGNSVSAPYLSVAPNTQITLGSVSVGNTAKATFLVTNLGTGGLDYSVSNGPIWNYCATESGYCAFSGTQVVHYGANGSYFFQTLTGGTWCNNAVFGGDPAYGFAKACWYTISPASEFICTKNCTASGLLNGQSLPVDITFSPSVAGLHWFFPLFTSNGGTIGSSGGGGSPSVSGNGVLDPVISVSPTSLGFPDTNQGLYSRKTITITNTGLGVLVGNIAQVKTPGLDFYCVLNCTYNILASGNIISTIEFAPNSVGSLSTLLTINSNAVNGTQSLGVFGNGVFAPIIDIRGSDTNYGPVVVGKFKDKIFTISNSGSVDLGSGTFTLTGPFVCINPVDISDGLCHYNIPAYSSTDITVRFSPTAIGSASGAVWLSGVPLARFFVSGTGIAPAVKFIEK